MFEEMVRGWFWEENDRYTDFIQAMLLGDVEAMNEYMNDVTQAVFSYFDTGRNPAKEESEKFYHGFVLGLMAELKGRYVLTSNRESGFGRYDVMLEPVDEKDDAMILEFKVHKPQKEENLFGTVQEALKQIEKLRKEADSMNEKMRSELVDGLCNILKAINEQIQKSAQNYAANANTFARGTCFLPH